MGTFGDMILTRYSPDQPRADDGKFGEGSGGGGSKDAPYKESNARTAMKGTVKVATTDLGDKHGPGVQVNVHRDKDLKGQDRETFIVNKGAEKGLMGHLFGGNTNNGKMAGSVHKEGDTWKAAHYDSKGVSHFSSHGSRDEAIAHVAKHGGTDD